mgnify:FL=1
MSKTITPVNTTDTFQVWLQRTNDLVTELGTSIVTASIAGDTTIGDATLTGSFTANTVVANGLLRTYAIDNLVGNSSPIDVRGQTSFNSTSQTSVIINNSLGPRIKIQNNNVGWLAGVRGSSGTGTDAQFVIGVEGSDFAFRIGTDGVTYANTVMLDTVSSSPSSAVRADRIISANNGIIGGGDLTADRTFGLTGNALAVHNLGTTGLITRNGANTMVTRTISNGTGITITNGDGVSGNPTVAVDSSVLLLSGAQTVTGQKTFSAQQTFSAGMSVGGLTSFTSNVNITTDDVLSFSTDKLRLSSDGTHASIKAATHLYIDMVQSGNVFIRDSSNLTKLTMNTSTGDLTAAGNITANSDERLKTNIRTVDNALSKVQQLRGVYFDKDGKASIGVIAQEVEQIIPEVVLNGEYKSVAYGNLVGLLIEAIKELNAKVAVLESQVK